MTTFTLPRHNSLISFLPAGNRPPGRFARLRKAVVRAIDRVRLAAARVHWATVADVAFLVVFFMMVWAFQWIAWAMGWFE
jgi:hypothetical protein